ncbi:MAG: hypothetical protein R6V02_12585, partial [Candidatus Aminicenantes bacterium]
MVPYISQTILNATEDYPENVTIDFGADGIVDYNYTGEFNDTKEIYIDDPIFNWSDYLLDSTLGDHLRRVPIEVYSATVGQLNFEHLNFTYNPNPVYL